MKQNVNYLMHHKNSNLKLIELNLNSTHISLYNALFLIWNECGFDTELSINRNDVMKLSKIGSANTYTKCLKELHDNDMINYKPSFNPLIGSKINLYRFDNGSDNSSDNGTVKSSSKGCDNSTGNGSDTLYKLLNKETIKLLNTNYKLVNEKIKNWIESEKPKNNIHTSFAHLKISFDEFNQLLNLGYSEIEIKNIFEKIENYKQNTKYKSLFLTSKNWLKLEKEKSSAKKESEPIVAGRQTMETIQQNLDTTGLYVPSLQNQK